MNLSVFKTVCTSATALFVLFTFCALGLGILGGSALAADKLPPEKAGEIGEPTGQIAFQRSQNVWVMNADGTRPRLVTESLNADGRLSFSPDNRRIMFTRSGQVSLEAPDGMGGKHKVYDLFIAYLDSAEAGTTHWWKRITNDLGSRDPEWMPDGRVLFYKDLMANFVNATMPNYQVCISDEEGNYIEVLRKNWQNADHFMIKPSISSSGHIAFEQFYDLQPQGIAVLHRDSFMVSWDSLKTLSTHNQKSAAPSWSPDGKWLAYIGTGMNNPGVYIASPDLQEKYIVFEPPVNVYPYSQAPSWSPDGTWLTFATTDGSIWISDITGNNQRRLTAPGLDRAPTWSH